MNTDWLSQEHLVHLIEKSIDPDSRVELNVKLKDLNSTSHKARQCDIVIRKGKPPRETITIVEVQKRSRKVELTTFDGWVTKMRDVGAQHLICVSIIGFPDSVKEKAKRSGNTIRLITIKNQDTQRIPIDIFQFNLTCNEPKYFITSVPRIKLLHKEDAYLGRHIQEYHQQGKLAFSFNKSLELRSLDGIVSQYLTAQRINTPGRLSIKLPDNKNKLYLNIEGHFVKISLKCEVEVKVDKHEGTVLLYSYEQESEGVLAWIFEGEVNLENQKVIVKIPAIPQPDGSFNVQHMSFQYSISSNVLDSYFVK